MPFFTYDAGGNLLRVTYAADGTSTTEIVSVGGLFPEVTSPPPQLTATDIITSALRLIGAVAAGETPEDAELSDGLVVLNQMIDSWNTERLMIFTTQPTSFALVAGKQAYTLGPGGDFNMERPARIDNAVLEIVNSGYVLQRPLWALSDEEWASIQLKNFGNTYPGCFWDDDGFPLRTLRFWPLPVGNLNVILWLWSSVSQFTDLTTAQTYPPGYAKALRYNLAVDLAAEFATQLSPIVSAIAVDSKAKLKRANSTPAPRMKVDPALQGANVPTGTSSMAAFYSGGFW